jgi:plastocyanin
MQQLSLFRIVRAMAGFAPAAALLTLAACGDSAGNNNGNNNGTEQLAKASPSGDNQQGNAGATLPDPLRVSVTKDGAAVSGKTITWQVTAGGGSVNPTSGTTGGDGIATTVVTLGNAQMTITASSAGVSGSPVSFTAGVIGLSANVSVANNTFSPQEVTIKAGGTVTFTWNTGASGHNVVPDDGKAIPASPDGGALKNAPFTFSVTFPTAGSYFYHCSAHGGNRSGMSGSVTVVP